MGAKQAKLKAFAENYGKTLEYLTYALNEAKDGYYERMKDFGFRVKRGEVKYKGTIFYTATPFQTIVMVIQSEIHQI